MPLRRPMVFVFIFVAGGIWFEEALGYRRFPWEAGCLAVFVALASAAGCRRWFRPAVGVALALAVTSTAAVWAHARRTFRPDDVWFRRPAVSVVHLRGVIVSDVRVRRHPWGVREAFILSVRGFGEMGKTAPPTPASGRVLVHLYRRHQVRLSYGDDLLLVGRWHRPFAGTSEAAAYRRSLRRRGVHFVLSVSTRRPLVIVGRGRGWRRWCARLRAGARRVLEASTSPETAAFLSALLLGIRDDLPRRWVEDMRRSGTAHLLAISGLHVGVASLVFFGVLRLLPIGMRMRDVVLVLLLWVYAGVTGARPSILRAVLTATFFFAGVMLERERDPFNILACAGVAILIVTPAELFEAGFQMSFLSVWGILAFAPPLQRWGMGRTDQPWSRGFGVRRALAASVAVSTGAFLGGCGVVAFHFHQIALYAVPANLLAVPLAALCVPLGLMVLALGAWAPWPARIPAAVVDVLREVLRRETALFAAWPGAGLETGPVPWCVCAAYYLLLGGVALWLARRRS